MNSVINVTVSTINFHSYDNVVTLLVNDRACTGNHSDSDIVECDHNVTQLYSFILTAINSGTVTIRAHTNYYGANWYSDSKKLSIIEDCIESKH